MIEFRKPHDPLAKLPALAKRLGVEPQPASFGERIAGALQPGLFLVTENGEKYDVFDLVNAVLDRLEEPSSLPTG